MLLADFVNLPLSRRGQLDEAHVVALRLYSTSAFNALNRPMRNLKCHAKRKVSTTRTTILVVIVVVVVTVTLRLYSISAFNALADTQLEALSEAKG